MTTIAWKINRLRSMSAAEVVLRGRRALLGAMELNGIIRPQVPTPAKAAAPRQLLIAPCSIPNPEADILTAHADRILAGQWQIFATEFELGFPPDWNRDPKSGRRAPLQFGKSIDYRNEALVGDIKYLWEINRHLELTTLAQAYATTNAPRYAKGARALIASWLRMCPHAVGLNWCSSLELAIRLVNWAISWELLDVESSPHFADPEGHVLRQEWLRSVFLHCDFIAGNLSLYSSANNHLLGEYTGLLVASLRWPLWARSKTWSRLARSGVEAEALRQNSADGVNLEQAFYYQHEVADMMLIAGLACRSSGCDLGPEYWKRLESMLEFVASVMDCAGHVPMIGDADDGRLTRLDPSPEADVYRSLLAAGAVLFERGDFKTRARRFDAKSRWLLGDAGARVFEALPAPGVGPIRTSFPEGGYYVLGSDLDGKDEIRVVADAGPLGYLSIAAHGHADALALVLSAGGQEILIDSGTYAYHTQRRWRDHFRGTRAHNTVCIDGQDQSRSGGAFLWLRKANVQVLEHFTSPSKDRLVARHDGYCALEDPVLHKRSVTLDKLRRILEVEDEVSCAARHRLELLWHLSERCHIVATTNGCIAHAGHCAVDIELFVPPGDVGIVAGQLDPPLGWISRRFDEKTPAPVLRYSADIEGTVRLRSQFAFRFGH